MSVRDKAVRAGALAWVALTLLAALLLAAQPAAAKGGGQIGAGWGTSGSANGQLFNPVMLGVDPVDGSVYTGDISGTSSEGEAAKYRIQKFSSAGTFQAAVEIPRFPTTGKLASLQGIAVDHTLGRIYVIEGCRVALAGGSLTCVSFGGKVGAKQILVYSTTPEGSALKPLSAIPLPAGANQIYEPQAIAVDPSNHDVLVLANENAKHRIVQRISSAGVLGARYTDAADVLKPASGGAANSLAVSPTGVAYTITGNNTPPSLFSRLWKLPAALTSLEEVASVTTAASKEEWINGMEASVEAFYGGPQLAVSSDGDTVYWKEQIKRSEEAEAGELTVRGFSLSKGETVSLWGGGSSSCKITTNSAALAATAGGNLVVLDTGQQTKKSTDVPAYGRKVYTFGAGGTGCKDPVAKFTVNGKTEAETPTGINPGESVAFNASSSELAGGARKELIWKFGDGTEQVVTAAKEGEEAPATVAHTYTAGGTYTVKLQIKLTVPIYGNPDVRERTFTVGTAKPKFTLKAKKAGTGQGTVTSSPAGIDCGLDCEEEYDSGKEVTLTALADAGSTFTGWSGAGCSGTGTCKVTMSAAKEATATFTLETRALKVNRIGGGTGTVTSSPSGINCGATCEAAFDFGTEVTLTASPTAGSTFAGWSGAGCTGTGTCKVTMSAAKEVSAEFTAKPSYLLKVARGGSGQGTVTSSPAGINCGATCEVSFTEGTEVTLTASPTAGSTFAGWSGAGCTGTGTCKVTMSAAKEVSASFAIESRILKVTKGGTGQGTVTSSPAGINCGATCEAAFDFGTEVTLTASPTAGSTFAGWSGAGCTGTSTCKVTMSAAKEVTATFAIESRTLKVTKAGTGQGTVTSSPSGINCGATCEAAFDFGAEVTLTPSPGLGSEFTGWSGACTGTGTCKVTMSAAREVSANFAIESRTLKLTKGGTGQGTVTSSPSGINCGATCEAAFDFGTEVTLTATPTAGSTFAGWSGAGCSGTGTCKVTMSGLKEVSASFTIETRILKVTKSGTGQGTVTSSPAAINCGTTCEAAFDFGAEVTLTPSPGLGSEFTGWSGACTGTGTCKVTMSQAREVGAGFKEAVKPQFALTVSRAGTGGGAVTSNPAGINCGSACEATFTEGTEVTLTATPDSASTFTGWSGACTGTGTCKVTVSAAKAVTATFAAKPKFTLKAKKAGTGQGTVTSSPAGIDCGLDCEEEYDSGKEVTLTALADAGSTFTGWSGAGCSGTGTCKVTMSAAKEATATFTLETRALKVNRIGGGTGTVTSSPSGINCGATCEAAFDFGTEVTLTASPTAGSTFAGWSGAGCTGTGTCKVTMSAAREVSAEFTAKPSYLLKVARGGSGQGTVTSSPAGINCGATCEVSFTEGTEVTLTASPTAGSTFAGWSGAGCTGTGTCKVTMSAAKEVSASFAIESRILKVTKGGTGQGTVTSSPAGINCGATCEAAFDFGTEVTLTASPTAGSTFAGWSGAGCTGTSTCKVTMSAAKEVTATFAIESRTLKVTKAGTGQGTVTSSPSGINCGATCEAAFDFGAEVTLTPSPGSEFTGWSGACTGTGTCKVTMSAAREVSANFAIESRTLKLTKGGTGQGTVTSSPSGINCGATCEAAFDFGTEVTLTATPTAGSTFAGWSGAGCSGTGTCKVTMSGLKEVSASFTIETRILKVTKSGTGQGTVTSSPAAINCGTTCEAAFDFGAEVTLTPSPGVGSEFTGWSGACTGTGTCKVTMSQAREVGAGFEPVTSPSFLVQVSAGGTGKGRIVSDPVGIDCPGDCLQEFSEGTKVKLEALPATGSKFTGWSGVGCIVSTCNLTVTKALTISAGFELLPDQGINNPEEAPLVEEPKPNTAKQQRAIQKQLKKQLKTCRKKKGKKQRVKCEKKAKAKAQKARAAVTGGES